MKRKGHSEAGGPFSERTPPGKAGAPRQEGHGANGLPPNSQDAALGEGAVGDALRSVYQQAVEEDIPPEMIDLLRKLS